jgi:hypothetical protein
MDGVKDVPWDATPVVFVISAVRGWIYMLCKKGGQILAPRVEKSISEYTR